MRFYLASRIENASAVRRLRDALKAAGHSITYDWSSHGAVFRADADPATNCAAMAGVAQSEILGVATADAVIVLLPGGRGTHVEIGAALGLGKPVIFAGEKEEALTGKQTAEFPWPCAFYYHPLASRIFDRDEDVRTRTILALCELRYVAPPSAATEAA